MLQQLFGCGRVCVLDSVRDPLSESLIKSVCLHLKISPAVIPIQMVNKGERMNKTQLNQL